MVCSTRRFVLSLVLCYFVLIFFSPFSIAMTSIGEQRANLNDVSAFRTFVRFALVWFCLFSLPLGVREGLRLVIVAHPGLFSHLYLDVSGNSRKNLAFHLNENVHVHAQLTNQNAKRCALYK